MIVCTDKTKKGVNVIFKYPNTSEVKRLSDYANHLAEEEEFLLFHGEKVSLAEERARLLESINEIKQHKAIYLVALVNNTIAGFGRIKLRSKVNSHIGDLEVSVAKKFRSNGVGSLLTSVLISEGEKKLEELRIISATTFEVNTFAKKMYKKLGFKKFGCLPEGVHHKGTYIGLLHLYKKIDL